MRRVHKRQLPKQPHSVARVVDGWDQTPGPFHSVLFDCEY